MNISSPLTSHTLVADSGSTKTDWRLGPLLLHTQGINPIHQDDAAIRHILHDELLPQLLPALPASVPEALSAAGVTAVRFYGSGVLSSEQQRVERLLAEALPSAARDIEARSDLLGAARALCGHSEGVACILGTGSNSCLFDGHAIVQNTPPLGYILGDEGSGAVLGIRLLGALYKGRLSPQLRSAFETWAGMTMADVIDRVYRQPLANRWLASLSPFVHAHLDDPSVAQLVVDHLRAFLSRNVRPYQRPDLPVHFVGSIAWHYLPQLTQATRLEGLRLGTVLRSPIDALCAVHASRELST